MISLSGCGRSSTERYVIVDKRPFHQQNLAYCDGSEAKIVATVRRFAEEQGMDYLGGPGHPTLDAGQFNLTAAGMDLNLKAIRVSTSLPYTQIFATSKGKPTPADTALAAAFVARLSAICR